MDHMCTPLDTMYGADNSYPATESDDELYKRTLGEDEADY